MGGRIGPRTVYVEHPVSHEFVRLNPGDEIPADLAHLVTVGAMAVEGVTPTPSEKESQSEGAAAGGSDDDNSEE